MFKKLVQDDLGFDIALELNHNAHAILIRFIADIRDAFDLLIINQSRNGFDQPGFLHLIRNFSDNN